MSTNNVGDQLLHELNTKHAVILDMGRVVEQVHDARYNRVTLQAQSFADFKQRYHGRRVMSVPLGQWWLDHPDRRQYQTVDFIPRPASADVYNLWEGFSVEPTLGHKHHRFMQFLQETLCGGDVAPFKRLIDWMACAVQHPDRRSEVAIVVRGPRGSGKSTFAKAFGGLFGTHYLNMSAAIQLVGSFNGHLRDCVVLFGDELVDKKCLQIFKALLTEDRIVIERKGQDVEVVPNYIHLVLGVSEDWCLPSTALSRRFFVLDVKPSGHDFQAMHAEFEQGGRSHLLHELLHRTLETA